MDPKGLNRRTDRQIICCTAEEGRSMGTYKKHGKEVSCADKALDPLGYCEELLYLDSTTYLRLLAQPPEARPLGMSSAGR